MGRYSQGPCAKGSQRWMQLFVNQAPEVLDEQIGLGSIDWRSPLAADEYAEYRDDAFLELLGISLPRRSLDSFWPRGGPQWDALGRAQSGEVILIEAKAHLNELYSPATGASESSLEIIRTSLTDAARGLGVLPGFDWSKQFYQYANRLAHAHFLDHVNGVPTKLVFLYFMGDPDMKKGPSKREEWETAIKTVHTVLGLKESPGFVRDVFIDVRSSVVH